MTWVRLLDKSGQQVLGQYIKLEGMPKIGQHIILSTPEVAKKFGNYPDYTFYTHIVSIKWRLPFYGLIPNIVTVEMDEDEIHD